MIRKLNIFTDGGARGNPGPAAIGVFIIDEENGKSVKIGRKIGVATNNVAEYKAVLEAFDWILDNREKFSENAKISFFLDSLLVCSQIKGAFKVKDPNLKNLMVLVKEKEAAINLPIDYNNIPREKNKIADGLVNAALDNNL